MTDNTKSNKTEVEQQTKQEPRDLPKVDPHADRFISKPGEMTITPPPNKKAAEKKPETLADTDHS